MSVINVKNVSRYFSQGETEIKALQNVNLKIEPGEFSALVGPSGSGKSTLLNCIGALDMPDSGSIEIAGQVLEDLPRNKLSDFRLHTIGFVFQAYNLLPVLTAFENVEYVLLLQGMPKYERREVSLSIMKEMGLEDLKDRFPRQLSGGQQQRVAVARALVCQPKVILADEPTANLDSENTNRLLDIMESMCAKTKTTFLFSTHDNRVVQRAKRIISLEDGMIVE